MSSSGFLRNFTDKVQYEFRVKHYDEALALLDSVSTYKNGRRRDLGDAVVYSIGTDDELGFQPTSVFGIPKTLRIPTTNVIIMIIIFTTCRPVFITRSAMLWRRRWVTPIMKTYWYSGRRVQPQPEQLDRTSKLDVGLTYVSMKATAWIAITVITITILIILYRIMRRQLDRSRVAV